MKKITTYVNAIDVCPSGYYRVLQYFDREQIKVHGLMPAWMYVSWHKSEGALKKIYAPLLFLVIFLRVTVSLLCDLLTCSQNDIIIINRTISPRFLPITHRIILTRLARKCSIIWDFDDNILLGNISRKEFDLLSKLSSFIVVTNQFLKNTVSPEYAKKVILLPTTDGDMKDYDYDRLLSQRMASYDNTFVMVWVGTGINIVNVQNILKSLDECAYRMLQNGKQLVLRMVSNKPLLNRTDYLVVENIEWSRQKAIEVICSAHVGIMPLIDNEYNRGKGGFKLIQYLSASLPVIASNTGYNNEIVTEKVGYLIEDKTEHCGWIKAIEQLAIDKDKYLSMNENARTRYFSKFSYDHQRQVWNDICNRI